jgi:Arc/MetJ-type ribon-helix-helix transcriptional regulator
MKQQSTTLTLTGKDTERLDRLVRDGGYPSREAAVSDALIALEDASSPDLDNWLRTVVAARFDDHVADPSRTMSLEEARRRLLGSKEQ